MLFVLLTVLNLCHLICLLLDELLFPAYRRVTIRRPVFVLGVPRSGTTATQALLARDQSLTSFSTWECLLAPSITQRMLVRLIARCDRQLGGAGERLLSRLESGLFSGMESIHPVRLSAPEEDYLSLLPYYLCSILVIPFPGMRWLWSVTRLDERPSAWLSRLTLHLYHRQLQRHLYFHGESRRLLSKNAGVRRPGAIAVQPVPRCQCGDL